MQTFKEKLVLGTRSGIDKGWSGFVWLLKILIPISFLTVLLEYSGWLNRIEFILSPVMSILDLPAKAAVPLIAGMLTGIYGGIAAMIVLPFTIKQMTLIAIFLLISHALIQETIVQWKSGIHPAKALLSRIITSIITVFIVSTFIPEDKAISTDASVSSAAQSFTDAVKNWALDSVVLCAQIFVIIMVLMILLGIMKHFDMIPKLIRLLRPVLKLLGLNERVGILWLTAAVFGISYGAAVIVEESKEHSFSSDEMTRLHLSIGINHAMIEDPALFLPLGLSPFWMWIPRFIAALIAVHLYILWQKLRQWKTSVHEKAAFRDNV